MGVITPTCTVAEDIFLLTKSRADTPTSLRVPFSFVTELSTRPHY